MMSVTGPGMINRMPANKDRATQNRRPSGTSPWRKLSNKAQATEKRQLRKMPKPSKAKPA